MACRPLLVGVLVSAALLGTVRGQTEPAVLPQSRAGAQPSPFHLNHERGFYDGRLELSLSNAPGWQVWYSTDGSRPAPQTARLWQGRLGVTNCTVLRIAAFRDDAQVSPASMHSYILPNTVPRQNGAGFPANWGVTNGQPVRAAYALDQRILDDPAHRGLAEPALKSIPSVSIVMDRQDLFGAERGIYAHPQESGIASERAGSVELLYPDGRPGFQIDCGIRIQGGWNRRPEESPKHAFRLVFNRRYGPSRLRFPVFGDGGVSEFETLILRAGCNNTWLHWSGEERRRGDYVRDQWMRDTMRAMGHVSPRGLFVHLYLDGLYWGLYTMTERPSAPFAASHFGGLPKDYDARNSDHVLEGTEVAWKDLVRLANGGVEDQRNYEAVQRVLDVPEFIDYMLVNLYGANADWDRASNWYAVRRRKPPGRFEFFIWDAERTLESATDNILDHDDDDSPLRLFRRLRQNAAFRLEFAEHARKHLLGSGALAPGPAGERFAALARQIELPIVMESARWGGYRRDVHPYKTGPYELYTRDGFWRAEIGRLLHEYFPRRSHELIQQLRVAGLFVNAESGANKETP